MLRNVPHILDIQRTTSWKPLEQKL